MDSDCKNDFLSVVFCIDHVCILGQCRSAELIHSKFILLVLPQTFRHPQACGLACDDTTLGHALFLPKVSRSVLGDYSLSFTSVGAH